MQRVKPILLAFFAAVGLLIATAFVMNNFAPSPVTAAKAHCVDHGWAKRDLKLQGYRSSAKMGGSKATVRFHATGAEGKQIVSVELHKSMFGAEWKLSEYKESTAAQSD